MDMEDMDMRNSRNCTGEYNLVAMFNYLAKNQRVK